MEITRNAQGFKLFQEMTLPFPLAQVFSFFSDAKNLQSITPDWLHFQILNEEVKLQQGSLIDYRLKIRGIPLRWQSEISVWEPPHRFVDRQTKGPYRFWIHEHRFQEVAGGTLIQDEVLYSVWGGSLIEKLFVRKDVQKIFEFRKQKIAELFKQANYDGQNRKGSS